MSNGLVSKEVVADKAARVVYSMAASGALDANGTGTAATDVTSPAHVALARRLAAASMTLLKNAGGLLPLNTRCAGPSTALVLI